MRKYHISQAFQLSDSVVFGMYEMGQLGCVSAGFQPKPSAQALKDNHPTPNTLWTNLAVRTTFISR